MVVSGSFGVLHFSVIIFWIAAIHAMKLWSGREMVSVLKVYNHPRVFDRPPSADNLSFATIALQLLPSPAISVVIWHCHSHCPHPCHHWPCFDFDSLSSGGPVTSHHTLCCSLPVLRRSRHQPPLALCCSCCLLVVALLSASCCPLLLLHAAMQPSTHLLPAAFTTNHYPLSLGGHITSHPRLCCYHCLMVVASLSTTRFCHCLVVAHCQHHQMALPFEIVSTTSRHWHLNLIVASGSVSCFVIFLYATAVINCCCFWMPPNTANAIECLDHRLHWTLSLLSTAIIATAAAAAAPNGLPLL